MTRSNPIRPSTVASASEVASASDPASWSSIRWTALSAPMDRALRMDSLALSGPMDKMVTSPPCASASRSPSSIAYSSISLMTPSGDTRSSRESSARRVRSAQVSGTCFMQTTMFMTGGRPPACDPVTVPQRLRAPLRLPNAPAGHRPGVPSPPCRRWRPGARPGVRPYMLLTGSFTGQGAARPRPPRWRAASPGSSARPRRASAPGTRPPRRPPVRRHPPDRRRSG